MKKYTFYTLGLDDKLYYPKKFGDQTVGWIADWTTNVSEAITWEKPEDFDCVMAEYVATQVIEIVDGVAKVYKNKG